MSEFDDKIVRFEQLNLLGKTIFLSGAAVHLTAKLIDFALERAVDVVVETEKAFKQGKDSNIEDAKILEERERGMHS